jgi:hypothetical protein
MSTVGTGHTTLSDPLAAATQVVERAKAGLEGKPTLAILFSTTDYDTEALVSAVQKHLGDVPLWGGTSSTGVFAPDGWITGKQGAASLMLLSYRPAGVGVVPVGDDPVAAGKKATAAALAQAGGSARVLLTLAFMGPEEDLLAGVAQVAPGVPVVGGSSSDHTSEGKWRQFGNGHSYQGAFTIAALGGEVGYTFAHGYKLTGKKAVITKATGRRLIELDHRPAMDVYAEWTGEPKAKLGGSAILIFSVLHPLLLHKEGVTLSVHPVGGNDDGSIDTGALLAEGQTLELGASTPDDLIGEVEKVIRDTVKKVAHPTAVLLSHCGGRAIALGDRIGEVAGKVQQAAPGLPWIGYLAFGEQGCALPGQASHANLSLSALVLGSD